MTPGPSSTGIWRSLGAIFAGILVGIVLSIGTDVLLRLAGVFPPLGQQMRSGLLLLATVYRTIYGVVSSYITAQFAPHKPMAHVLILGLMGLAANALGTVSTWNKGPAFGPHWYPIALTVLALPTAWFGGKLWLARHVNAPIDRTTKSV
jgi:hypothetical protein